MAKRAEVGEGRWRDKVSYWVPVENWALSNTLTLDREKRKTLVVLFRNVQFTMFVCLIRLPSIAKQSFLAPLIR